DEVTWDQPRALVDELIKGVLAVGSRFTPVNGTSLVIYLVTIEGNGLSVTLHGQLLQIRREPLQVLLVGKNCDRRSVEEVDVPNANEPNQGRELRFERSGVKRFIYLMQAVQDGGEVDRADGHHRREPDGREH